MIEKTGWLKRYKQAYFLRNTRTRLQECVPETLRHKLASSLAFVCYLTQTHKHKHAHALTCTLIHRNMCALTHHTHTFTWNLEAHGALATAAEGLELALSQHTLIHRNMCALTHTHAYLKTRGTWSACYRSRGA